MKIIILLALISFAAADDDHYDLETVGLDTLKDEELKSFIDCLVQKVPCTNNIYQKYRDIAPECVRTACKKCTVEVKHIGSILLDGVKNKVPADYDLFKKLYDPENKYFDAFETELNKFKTI